MPPRPNICLSLKTLFEPTEPIFQNFDQVRHKPITLITRMTAKPLKLLSNFIMVSYVLYFKTVQQFFSKDDPTFAFDKIKAFLTSKTM